MRLLSAPEFVELRRACYIFKQMRVRVEPYFSFASFYSCIAQRLRKVRKAELSTSSLIKCVLLSAVSITGTVVAQPLVLPDLSNAKAAPLQISSTNIRQYGALLVPELYQLFQEAPVFIEAGSLSSVPPAWDQDWIRASASPLESVSMDFVALRAALSSRRGFLFGTAEQIRRESDPDVAAKKILWNSYGVLASQRASEQQFQFFWVGSGKMYRVMSGRLARVYPPALVQKDVPTQLWRESIRILSPQPVRGFEWLTFRLFAGGEDAFWLYSPVISKLRQLSGSNRGDPFFRSEFAPDDMFAWSGAWDLVSAKLGGQVTALVPFSSTEYREAVSQPNGCQLVSRGASGSAVEHLSSNWNFETGKFNGGAGWLPTASIFTPRLLWRVDLSSRDPFAKSGRQVLYVDQENMLPVYRFVYDKTGRLDKTIMALYGSAADSDKHRWLYNAWVLVYSHARHEAYIVDSSRLLVCNASVDGLRPEDFEPARFSSPAIPSAKVAVSATPSGEGPDEL
ncbi:MAG: outer membrane lipoprotein-sorting protein [Oligoflexia bacterium]|nr:outer membrane lipoprotein-sorting protein [Oligoflexia bacterium]